MGWLTIISLVLAVVIAALILLWALFVFAINWAADKESGNQDEI